MDEAIRRYADQVRHAGPGAVGFFYYSGHGAVNPESNVNYLIPVDLDMATHCGIAPLSSRRSSIF